ncbi:MAG: zinc-dependent alcohol dehydrogenase family protein [Rhodomicrobium sp.]
MTRVVRFHRTGGPEVLQFDDLDIGDPGPGEVRVRVEAIGLNRAEALFRAGTYLEQPNLPVRLGYEASAIVQSWGEGVTGYQTGQAVNVIPAFSMNNYGVYAEEAIVPAMALVRRAPGLNAIEAAAVWMANLTAGGALLEIGNLDAGDAVIITAASSSVGIAAIQITNSKRAIPIAVTRTAAKKDKLKELGAKHVIVLVEEDLVSEVNSITGGDGARFVFDPVAGPLVTKLAQAASPLAVLFIYGNLSGVETPFPTGAAIRKGLTLRGYTLFEIVTDAGRLANAVEFVMVGLRDRLLRPVVAKVFHFDEIVEAHRYLESNQQIGKIVVTVP